MSYTTFNRNKNNQLTEPMFLGQGVNVARYDQQKYPIFDKLTEKQLSFFWRPEEVDVTSDRAQYVALPEHQKHIFNSNLKYQILLDSIQGRSPNMALLPIVSLPELETWIETWSFSETIHSRSYTHIIRNIVNNPGEIFDTIVEDVEIGARASDITKYYDDLIKYTQLFQLFGEGEEVVCQGEKIVLSKRELMKKTYICLMSVNILEAIRFYVSFACSFSFAERELMEGNAKIIKLIARDEALHLSGTQQMINILRNHGEGLEWSMIAMECEQDCINLFEEAVDQESGWAEHLFKDGSMPGVNAEIISQYVRYLANRQMKVVGLPSSYEDDNVNPLPWMNSWLVSDNVQVAPQEAEISSYLVGQVEQDVHANSFAGFEL